MSSVNEWSGDDARRAELNTLVAAAKAVGAVGIELRRADYDRIGALLGIQEKIVSLPADGVITDTYFFDYEGIRFQTTVEYLTR